MSWWRAIRSAPPSLRVAAAISAAEALLWAAALVVGSITNPPGGQTHPLPAATVGLMVTVAVPLFGSLFALPANVTRTRYPRRRYWEAVVFQAMWLLLFGVGFAFQPGPIFAVLTLMPGAAIWALLRPESRRYVSEREARYAKSATATIDREDADSGAVHFGARIRRDLPRHPEGDPL